MADPTDQRSPSGVDAAMSGYASASKSLQSFASEIQRLSKDALDNTSQLMEKLRNAKTLEETVSIQTSFMQQSLASYADYTRRFSELMMTMPMELAKQGQSAFQQGTDTMTKATAQAGEQIQKAGEAFNQHHG